MSKETVIDIFDLVECLAKNLSLMNLKTSKHHIKTAHFAVEIAEKCGFSLQEKQEIVYAAMFHDTGIFSMNKQINSLGFDFVEEKRHTGIDCLLLKIFAPFNGVAGIIKYHHNQWDKGAKKDTPITNQIIHLADKIDILYLPIHGKS